MTGPGTVLWSLVCGSARCRSRWSAAWTWWHMCVRQPGAATRPCGTASIRPRSYLASVRGAAMLTATGQDGRPAGSTGPIRRGADRRCSPGRPPSSRPVLEFRSVILSFRHFPPSSFREDLIDLPVRELGGTSTSHLAVAGGVHFGRADGLRRRALRLQ
jgi:hypothetical protein